MNKQIIPPAESKSADLIQENIEQLKHIFPEVIKEGKIDFEALNDLLGNYTDTPEERFHLNWAGKANARREAQKRSTGTLRPCPEESLDWDTTENLYIEGDNLEVLKLMQKSYHNKVKMIYIDPPYNTGKDFVYKDNYKDNMQNYLELTGQDKKLSTNTESDGRYHSNWLNMMYPRLKLARNLLTDDGVIFISIDDNEVANLRKVCDEIFGEENFEGHIHWRRRHNQPNDKTKLIGLVAEHILVYAKYSDKLKEKGVGKLPLTGTFSNPDNDPRGKWASKPWKVGSDQNGSKYIIVTPTGIEYNEEWMGEENTFKQLLEDNRIVFTNNGNGLPRKKYFRYEREEEGQSASNWWPHELFGNNQEGNAELTELFNGNKNIFSNPKNTRLLTSIVQLGNLKNNDIILDFFSGSATTAHAVMQLNAEDGGNRKYICVQIPEPTPEDSEARKAGYNTIPEIAKERIRRAGKKIVEEQKEKAEKEGDLFAEEPKKLDIGFKVFKLDSSNINAWDSNPENLETALQNSLFNIKDDRSEDDLLYEILIKYGIELTEKINRHSIDGKTVYEMGAGSLIVCLADNLTTDVAEGIGKLYEDVSPEGVDVNCRVVFKDSGFNGSDEVKTNTMLILKQHGIFNVTSV